MEQTSLHPFDLADIADYVAAIGRVEHADGIAEGSWQASVIDRARRGLRSIEEGRDEGSHQLTYGLGQFLCGRHPSFVLDGLSLTAWEARIDRGAGMLMRPPSRLFVDAGLEPALARRLPIRLDLSRGLMGGAFVPARLIPDLQRLLDARLERHVRRLIDAELDPYETLGLMFQAVEHARQRNLGLYEAIDVVADGTGQLAPGARIMVADRERLDRGLRRRIEEAAKPPKKPGLIARLRRSAAPAVNGATPPDLGGRW